MLRILIFVVASIGLIAADKDDVTKLVQKTFDAMAAKDAAALESCFTKDARLIAIRENGQFTSTPSAEFVQRISTMAPKILERMWNPEVRVSGRLATLWAPYDFHRDGKQTHCGIDQVDLVNTAEGWRIASIIYTVQTKDCPASPLGPIN